MRSDQKVTPKIIDEYLHEGKGGRNKLIKDGPGEVVQVIVGTGSNKMWLLYDGDPTEGKLIQTFPSSTKELRPEAPSTIKGECYTVCKTLKFSDSIWLACEGEGGWIKLIYE